MVRFDAAHAAVHYPPDRRFRIWVRPSILVGVLVVVLAAVLVAWAQYLIFGLPEIGHVLPAASNQSAGPHGFPLWIRYSHFFNFLFVTMLIRSGLSILVDHPRLYFNDDCTPGTEWLRVTPLKVPTDRLWTAKDDARYISPWVALPGYRHTIGIARAWHFINVYGFIVTGVFFVVMLFATEQWRRIVPTSPQLPAEAWNTFVHYATFHLPPEPDGFYGYNALQQIAYFVAVFGFGPTAIAAGIAMSPAVVNRYTWYARLFGGRQSARSIHFINMLGFVAFLIVHVTLVIMTGFARNMNHIVMGTDDPVSKLGLLWGFVGIAVVILAWSAAHHVSWNHPRLLQHSQKMVQYPLLLATLDRLAPRQRYGPERISPYFWPNGKLPVRQDWKELASDRFRGYRLRVGGLVENPVSLSLEDIGALGTLDVTSMHHCIQGWSGIARWTGLPMKTLVDLVRPKTGAGVVVFYSFGEGLYGGTYYETQRIDNVLKPECMLATHMNGQPLGEVYGAPLRLRVENQLGYKMVKWIERIEFVVTEKTIGAGEGGKNEDDEYFDELPNI